MVHFTVERARAGNRSVNSSDVPLANFHGFSTEMLEHSGPAKFTYVQDAATLQCEGKFSWGRGAGSFTLTANPEFTAELNRLGFASPREDDLFPMVLSRVNLDFIREVHAAGIATSLHEVLDMTSHGVTSQYIHEVNRAGDRSLRAQDYIEMRDHGVNARFLEELKTAGYQLRTEQVIELQDHGVDAKFMRDLGAYNLHPDPSELVALRDHGVTPEYLRGCRDAGYTTIPADRIIELRDHGVSKEFLVELHDLGYRFSPSDVVQLHDHGVDGHYLRNLHDSGMRNLNAEQIVQLHDHGVE
ncbi:MAG: hypothetical protein WDO73_22075 [Ignavibacteriota bacterium]